MTAYRTWSSCLSQQTRKPVLEFGLTAPLPLPVGALVWLKMPTAYPAAPPVACLGLVSRTAGHPSRNTFRGPTWVFEVKEVACVRPDLQRHPT